MPKITTSIKRYAERYQRYQIIKAITQSSLTEKNQEHFAQQAIKIDLAKDYPHIIQLVAKQNKTPKSLIEQIEKLQQQHKLQVWEALCKTHSILTDYEKLAQECAKTHGYKGEQLDKSLQAIAKTISENKPLMNRLKQDLPKIATKIQDRANSHQMEHVR